MACAEKYTHMTENSHNYEWRGKDKITNFTQIEISFLYLCIK